MCYLFYKTTGAISSSESAVTESKSEGDEFKVVFDTANTAAHDADVTEEPTSKKKEGRQHTSDANDKNLTVVKSSAQQSTVSLNEKNNTAQHDSTDKQKKNKSGATTENATAIDKGKSKEEDNGDKATPMLKTESSVQGSNSIPIASKAVIDKAVTDKAVTSTTLSAGAAKSLTEAISKDRKGIKNVEQSSVVDGTKDATVTGVLHHIGVDKEEKEQKGQEEQGGKEGDQGPVHAEEEAGEEVDEEEEGEGGGLELELGSSVDDSMYFKNTYSETASSEGGNSDSIRSIDPHADSNKTVEPASPTSRYVRLD